MPALPVDRGIRRDRAFVVIDDEPGVVDVNLLRLLRVCRQHRRVGAVAEIFAAETPVGGVPHAHPLGRGIVFHHPEPAGRIHGYAGGQEHAGGVVPAEPRPAAILADAALLLPIRRKDEHLHLLAAHARIKVAGLVEREAERMPEIAGERLRHRRLRGHVELHDSVAADRVERFCFRIEGEPGRLRHGIRPGDPAGGPVDRHDLVLEVKRGVDRVTADGQRHEIGAEIGRAVIARLHPCTAKRGMRGRSLGERLRPLRDEQLVFPAAEAGAAAGLGVKRVDPAAVGLIGLVVRAVHRHVDHARGGVVGQRRVDAVEHAPVEIAAPGLTALGVHALDAAAQFVDGPEQVDVALFVRRGAHRIAVVAAHAAAAVFRRPRGCAAVVHAGDEAGREPGVSKRPDRVAARRHRLPVVIEAVPDLSLLAGRPFGPREQGADDLAVGPSSLSGRWPRDRDGQAHVALGRVRVAERDTHRRRGGHRRRPELLFVGLLLRERRRHRPGLDKVPAAPVGIGLIGKPGGTDEIVEAVAQVVDAAAGPVALERHHPISARLRRRGHVQKLPGDSPFHRIAPLGGCKPKQALVAREHALLLEVPAVGDVGGRKFCIGVLPERHVGHPGVLRRIPLDIIP